MANELSAVPSLDSSVPQMASETSAEPSLDSSVSQMASETSAEPSLDSSVPQMASETSAEPSLDSSVPQMASETSAAPSLVASVPGIAIAGPSTLNQVPSIKSSSEISRAESPPHLEESETEQAVHAPLVSEESSDLSDSIGDFIPRRQSIDESREVVQDEERSNPDPDIDDLRRDSRCCREWQRCKRLYYALSECMDTKYALIFWIPMMALPISAISMGAIFFHDCIMSSAMVPLVLTAGFCDAILIISRIILLLHRDAFGQKGLIAIHIIRGIAFLGILIISVWEVVALATYSPSFDKSSPNYCNQILYYYAMLMIFVALSTSLQMILTTIIFLARTVGAITVGVNNIATIATDELTYEFPVISQDNVIPF